MLLVWCQYDCQQNIAQSVLAENILRKKLASLLSWSVALLTACEVCVCCAPTACSVAALTCCNCHPPPKKRPVIMILPHLPALALQTALFFYHTSNQTDSGALKPFLQRSDGERGPRTSLMQPLSPGLVSWSHLWKKRRGERGKMSVEEECVCVCGAERERQECEGVFTTLCVCMCCACGRDTVVLPQIKGRKSESLSHVS